MSEELVVHIVKNMLLTTVAIAAPMLLTGLAVGLAVGIFQTVTQINEMTLTFIPKIIAVVLTLLFLLPWMMNLLLAFTRDMFKMMITLAR